VYDLKNKIKSRLSAKHVRLSIRLTHVSLSFYLERMSKEFKPTGYNSVSPYFVVAGAEQWITLMRTIFGATEMRRYTNDNGGIAHVELRIDDSIIMVSEATANYPANEFLMHVYVPDVHSTFKNAIEAGCQSVQEPVQKNDDLDMRGMFKDPAGHTWAVSTQADTRK